MSHPPTGPSLGGVVKRGASFFLARLPVSAVGTISHIGKLHEPFLLCRPAENRNPEYALSKRAHEPLAGGLPRAILLFSAQILTAESFGRSAQSPGAGFPKVLNGLDRPGGGARQNEKDQEPSIC